MRKRTVILIAVCFALAFTPMLADRADYRGRSAERTVGSSSQNTPDVFPARPLQTRALASTNDHRAASLVTMAGREDNIDLAIGMVMQALAMDPQEEKLLAEAYELLGDLYEGTPSKQVQALGLAMQYAPDAGTRSQLQQRISGLGGDVFDFAAIGTTTANTQTCNFADTCQTAEPITLDAYLTGLNIENFLCSPDNDWFSFNLAGAEGEGFFVKIETISDDPPFVDDTYLGLWSPCDAQLYFNDDGGEGFMSLIETDCLPAGDYYIQVGGYFDISSPDNFDLSVEVTGTCVLPTPDEFEPDDDRADANPIGWNTPCPNWLGYGAWKEVQQHTIFPAFDVDHVKFDTWFDSFVSMGTATEFPGAWNDFTSIPLGTDGDSYIWLLYGDEPNYGGFCNDPDIGFLPYCKTDLDCPAPTGAPLPDFPTCIPIYFFSFNGNPWVFIENPLAFNEDISFFDWGSEIALCLPKTGAGTGSATASGGWVLRILSSPVFDPAGVFFYQVRVKNETLCRFEVETNDDFVDATQLPYHAERGMSGFYDISARLGYEFGDPADPLSWYNVDNDLYQFDICDERPDIHTDDDSSWDEDSSDDDSDSCSDYDSTWCFGDDDSSSDHGYEFRPCPESGLGEVLMFTDAPDSFFSDTALELYVGPDDDGLYYFTGISDDDSGPGWLSAFAFIGPPGSDLLGNVVNDADYFVNVTSLWLNLNFSYTLFYTIEDYVPPIPEVEPNDTCDIAMPLADGDTYIFDIDPSCDYDAFTFTLAADSYVILETDGGDTTMLLEDATGGYLGCDDDSSTGYVLSSRIEGCLPAGDYCARIRAYSSFGTILGSELVFDAEPGCTVGPPLLYDELYRCDGFGYLSPQDEFNTCPN